jgi:hypothetical protein
MRHFLRPSALLVAIFLSSLSTVCADSSIVGAFTFLRDGVTVNGHLPVVSWYRGWLNLAMRDFRVA